LIYRELVLIPDLVVAASGLLRR